jgi:hypothetical protein
MSSPDPIESVPNWFIHLEDKPEGPCTPEQILEHIRDGRANAETKVWCEGWENWKPAGESEEFAVLFESDKANVTPNGPVDSWHLVEDDEAIGPFSTADLVSRISTGAVSSQRWVLKSGWEQWRQVVTVEEFRHLLPTGLPAVAGDKAEMPNKSASRKLKWIGGSVAGLFVFLWMFSGGEGSPSGKQTPEEAFMEIARQGEQRMKDADGKPCSLCRGSGRTGKLDGCPDCKDPTSFDPLRRSFGTRTTPSGYVIVCTTCAGKGLVPEVCSSCRGSGVFRY